MSEVSLTGCQLCSLTALDLLYKELQVLADLKPEEWYKISFAVQAVDGAVTVDALKVIQVEKIKPALFGRDSVLFYGSLKVKVISDPILFGNFYIYDLVDEHGTEYSGIPEDDLSPLNWE